MEKVRLDIAQVTPGMKLAEPIANASGITLMPSGIRLTPMFIARIKKWNIETLDVFVENSGAAAPAAPAAAAPAKTGGSPAAAKPGPAPSAPRAQEFTLTAEQEQFARAVAGEVSRAFVNVRTDPLMMALRACAIKRLVMAGQDSVINFLRRGPREGVPLPEEKV